VTEPKRTRHRGPPGSLAAETPGGGNAKPHAGPGAKAHAGPNAPSVAPLPVRPNATLAELAREWLKLRDKRTRQADTERLRNHVLPLLGGVRVRELEPAHVTSVVQDTLAKKGMTVKSARNAYAVFSELIADALARGFIEADPRVLPPDIWPEDDATRPMFDESEVSALVSDERLPEPQRMYHRVAFDTGLPSAVLAELTFGDWRQRLESAPPPELDAAVEAWRAEGFARCYGRPPEASDRLLPRAASSPEPHTEGSAFKAFRRACVALGIKTRSPAAVRNTYEARRGPSPRPPAAS
jgi:hypothetical protein